MQRSMYADEKRYSNMLNAVLHTNGASKGNPGPSGIGFTLKLEDGTLYRGGSFIGTTTNSVAEYNALLWGLENAKAASVTDVRIQTDSELLASQIKGEERVKNEGLKPLYAQILILLGDFKHYTIDAVTPADNSMADALVAEALDKRATVGEFLRRPTHKQSLFNLASAPTVTDPDRVLPTEVDNYLAEASARKEKLKTQTLEEAMAAYAAGEEIPVDGVSVLAEEKTSPATSNEAVERGVAAMFSAPGSNVRSNRASDKRVAYEEEYTEPAYTPPQHVAESSPAKPAAHRTRGKDANQEQLACDEPSVAGDVPTYTAARHAAPEDENDLIDVEPEANTSNIASSTDEQSDSYVKPTAEEHPMAAVASGEDDADADYLADDDSETLASIDEAATDEPAIATEAVFEMMVKSPVEIAHKIAGFDGDEAKLHGHTWEIEATVESTKLDKTGMIYDFESLHKDLDSVLAEYDHRYLNKLSAFENGNPTPENMARSVYENLANRLPAGVNLIDVSVWQTSQSRVRYYRRYR